MSSAPTLLPLPGPTPAQPQPAAPRVDVVVPVHNEQHALPWSIRRLHDHLSAELPYAWRCRR